MVPEKHCRVLNCQAVPSTDATFPYYCGHHSGELSRALFTTIDGIAKLSSEIYIGRTYHPERRLLQHFVDTDCQRPYLTILHWAGCHEEIRSIEEKFIQHYKESRKLLKLRNECTKSEGALTSPWNCLYASWNTKAEIKQLPAISFMEIRDLSYGNRLWPDRAFPLHPQFLKAGLKLEEAKAALGAFGRQART